MDPLEELTQQVVKHLSNHSNIVLRWQPPQDVNALGQCYRFKDGSARIDVHPNLSANMKLSILVHECAHIRHDFSWMPIVDGVIRAESVKRTEAARQEWRSHPRESRAKEQANEWLRWVENTAYKHYKYDGSVSTIQAKLLALLAWRG